MKCKGKGGKYERDMCRALSKWVSGGKRADLYWRSAMSGGRARVMAKRGDTKFGEIGDISAVYPSGQPLIDMFVIECKHRNRAGLCIDSLIWNQRGGITAIWERLVADAATRGKRPMLLVRQNGKPDLMILDREGVIKFPAQIEELAIARIYRKGMVIFLLSDVMKTACSFNLAPLGDRCKCKVRSRQPAGDYPAGNWWWECRRCGKRV